jgi:hypothetical protein
LDDSIGILYQLNESHLINLHCHCFDSDPFDSAAKQNMISSIRSNEAVRRNLDFSSFIFNELKYLCARGQSACKVSFYPVPLVCVADEAAEQLCKAVFIIVCSGLSGIKAILDGVSFNFQKVSLSSSRFITSDHIFFIFLTISCQNFFYNRKISTHVVLWIQLLHHKTQRMIKTTATAFMRMSLQLILMCKLHLKLFNRLNKCWES